MIASLPIILVLTPLFAARLGGSAANLREYYESVGRNDPIFIVQAVTCLHFGATTIKRAAAWRRIAR
jgi:hypothetical protein